MSTCQAIMNALEKLAPTKLAESWDNVGLLIGHPTQPVKGIVIALDVDSAVVQFAIDCDANLIIAHHPVIFKGISSIRQDTSQGDLLYRLIQGEIAVIAAHTNLDAARGGVNDALAGAIGLKSTAPLLATHTEKLYKLAVYVPEQYLEIVRNAIGEAGAGHIGVYSHCSFSTRGEGTFMPLASAKPFIGTSGQLEKVDEYKIETIVPESLCRQVIAAMLSAHPYEEVAYDLYLLENQGSVSGMGRIGRLEQPMPLHEFVAKVKTSLGANAVKAVGNPAASIQRVALCGGSGAGFISQAKRAGADVYLTGDVKYHEAQAAEALGLALVDAGHFATEFPVIECLLDYLSTCSQTQKWDIPIYPVQGKDIFWSI